jgi:RimJ/RimL family protein N-acetyltransferase
MEELPRFESPIDPRPNDEVWQGIKWPVPPKTSLQGKYVLLYPTGVDDIDEQFEELDRDECWEHAVVRPAQVENILWPLKSRDVESPWQPWTVRLANPYAGKHEFAFVGTTSYLETSIRDARTEIGATTYIPEVWGTKVNPETKYLLLKYAFEELGMGRVQLKTDIRNVRSQQAIARLGATYEGILRRYQRRADGTIRDTVLFAISAEEWPKVRARLEERLYSE